MEINKPQSKPFFRNRHFKTSIEAKDTLNNFSQLEDWEFRPEPRQQLSAWSRNCLRGRILHRFVKAGKYYNRLPRVGGCTSVYNSNPEQPQGCHRLERSNSPRPITTFCGSKTPLAKGKSCKILDIQLDEYPFKKVLSRTQRDEPDLPANNNSSSPHRFRSTALCRGVSLSHFQKPTKPSPTAASAAKSIIGASVRTNNALVRRRQQQHPQRCRTEIL